MPIETDKKPDSNKFPESDLQIWMIIPAYNEEKFIGKVLQDLFNRGLNLIVIDDGSRDNTYQIVQDLIKESPRQRIPLSTSYKSRARCYS